MAKWSRPAFWTGAILALISLCMVCFAGIIYALPLVHVGVLMSIIVARIPKLKRLEKWKSTTAWFGVAVSFVFVMICDYFYIMSNQRMAMVTGVIAAVAFYGTWIVALGSEPIYE